MTEVAVLATQASPCAPAPVIPRLTLTVAEAAQALGIGETLARELVRSGQLPVLRLGRRVLVARSTIERLLDADYVGVVTNK